MANKKKKEGFESMNYLQMQALVAKGFSFESLTSHPSLIYRRTMMKRRGQILKMMAILQGADATNRNLKVTYD
jgi:phosphoenolpyruvate carboxylase